MERSRKSSRSRPREGNMQRPRPLRADRLRQMEPPFAWIPFAFLRDGYLAALSGPATLLYLFLCLVADAYGVSFYGQKRLEDLLDFSEQVLEAARRELCQRDLVAFDGRTYQVLSLPGENREETADARPQDSAQGWVHISHVLGHLRTER